ncbi:uncharacterized protein [Amphiura filiformis]|uniref:uncharacterized protein n=1 Tax=Amphiura filiformis TaxID=82378 RepID=UPI003B228C6A
MAEIQEENQEVDIKPLKIISAKVSNYVYDCFEQMKREMKIDTNGVALRFLLEMYQKTCGEDSYEVPFRQYQSVKCQSSETSNPVSLVPSMRHEFAEKENERKGEKVQVNPTEKEEKEDTPHQMGVKEPKDDVKEDENDDDDDDDYDPEDDVKEEEYDDDDDDDDDDDYDPEDMEEDGEEDRQHTTGQCKIKRMQSDKRPKKEKHVEWHTLPLKIKCKLCNELLPDIEDMKRHVISEHSNQHFPMPKRHKDQVVRENMGNVDASISDFEVSALLTRMRCCQMCNEYVPEHGIGTHQDRHGRLDIMCELCGEVFSSKWRLTGHKANKHDNKLHQCDECGKSYTNRNRLQSHKDRHKKCICDICGKELNSRRSYERHKVTHLVVKPYQCSECGKGFSQNTNLKSHMRVHTGVKPFRCDLCPQAFTHNVSLKTHKKKTHGIDMWVANSDLDSRQEIP